MYNINETCEQLGISIWTLKNWYRWEKKLIEEGEVKNKYLPVPETMMNTRGKPQMWSDEMIEKLKQYQSQVVVGRNGIYGKYTNPVHDMTKKVREQCQENSKQTITSKLQKQSIGTVKTKRKSKNTKTK